jgi:hypothetical protein
MQVVMVTRIAAILALCAFSLTLVLGLEAQNSFTTTVWRAMSAMAGTLFIGLILGYIFQKMMEENLASLEKKLKTTLASAKDGRGNGGEPPPAGAPPKV